MRYFPKNAGMTIEDIAEIINLEAEMHGIDFNTRPGNIPSDMIQPFVDDLYDLREDYVDEAEEDFVDARSEMIKEVIKTIEWREHNIIC